VGAGFPLEAARLFVWKEKLTVRGEIDKASQLEATTRGSNRRAVGLVPFPTPSAQREIAEAKKVRYQQLLISIEGKQSTCCLKVVSPKKKSRSALLCFRGRALGCIYGRKDMDSQMLGFDAFAPFLDDISIPDSIVDTYILPEDLALAASSLFHGDVFNQPSNKNAIDTLHYVHHNLFSSQMPGCIVLKRAGTEEVLAFIYMFGGKVTGVFTFANGWLQASFEQALELVQTNVQVMVSASKLNACNVEEVFDLSFSLTGMDGPSTYVPRLRPMDLY
jgi:hypothetical protein